MATDEDQGIGEGGLQFAVPSGRTAWQGYPSTDEVMGEQRNQGEEAKQGWSGTSNRLLRKVLMPALTVLLNVELGNPPLQLAQVVA